MELRGTRDLYSKWGAGTCVGNAHGCALSWSGRLLTPWRVANALDRTASAARLLLHRDKEARAGASEVLPTDSRLVGVDLGQEGAHMATTETPLSKQSTCG